jgi:hypothetical protein
MAKSMGKKGTICGPNTMVGENKYDGIGYPFKLLIEESLMQRGMR